MDILSKVITGWTVENTPKTWGVYHLVCWAIMTAATVLLTVFVASKHDPKKDRIVVGAFGTALLLAEIYKQVFYTKLNGYYKPYDFPFQFCSVPMWVMFFVTFFREGKVKDALYKFLATAGLVAGFSVMVFPSGVFATHYVTILAHTMFWHASQVIVGVYLIVSRGYGKSIRNLIKDVVPGVICLFIFIAFALLVNVVWHNLIAAPLQNFLDSKGISGASTDVNFFYISPYGDNTLVVLGWFRTNTPYPVFLFIYCLAFTLGCFLVWFITYGIRWAVIGIGKLVHRNRDTEKTE